MLTPEEVLYILKTATLQKLKDLPSDSVGIYILADHQGKRSYIGCTKAKNENFKKRIFQRHRTGSETHSHYFSRIYNIGVMWRDRETQKGHLDAAVAKALRNHFIALHCRAVCVPIDPNKQDIMALEKEVISLAPSDMCAWNSRADVTMQEPIQLITQLIDDLNFDEKQRGALGRQAQRWEKLKKQ